MATVTDSQGLAQKLIDGNLTDGRFREECARLLDSAMDDPSQYGSVGRLLVQLAYKADLVAHNESRFCVVFEELAARREPPTLVMGLLEEIGTARTFMQQKGKAAGTAAVDTFYGIMRGKV